MKIIRNQKSNAFTLAEILITLAIIGVVAALTIPALVQSYKKAVVGAKLAKFYSTINEAIARSEIDNGDKMTWDVMYTVSLGELYREGISAKEWYEKYLARYIQVLKTEETNTHEKVFNVYFPDGSMVGIWSVHMMYYPNSKDYEEQQVVTDDGEEYTDRKRADSGIKYFLFHFDPYNKNNKQTYNKGVVPYMDSNFDGSNEMLKNNPKLGCRQDVTNERAYCTELIRRNGWKIPKDYPLKF